MLIFNNYKICLVYHWEMPLTLASDSPSTQVIDINQIISSDPKCPLAYYKITDTTTLSPMLTLDTSCPDPPDTSEACRKMTFASDKTRFNTDGYLFTLEADVVHGGSL